jgi:hypothetical protein
VTTNAVAATTAAPARPALSADRPVLTKVPRRIGISIRKYESTATTVVTAIRTRKSGAVERPVRSPSSHRKIGQWNRYRP